MLRFFTYGDLPLERHLEQIEEEALSKFERIRPNTAVPAQPRWSRPVSSNIGADVFTVSTGSGINPSVPLFGGGALVSGAANLISLWRPQREEHVSCSPDPLAPDQSKQTTLCISYLLGE